MSPFINLTVEDVWIALRPLLPHLMVELITVDALPVDRNAAVDWQIKILVSDSRRGGPQSGRESFRFGGVIKRHGM
jgi:hypothetical protein